jgi:hypothetical protein
MKFAKFNIKLTPHAQKRVRERLATSLPSVAKISGFVTRTYHDKDTGAVLRSIATMINGQRVLLIVCVENGFVKTLMTEGEVVHQAFEQLLNARAA